MTASSDGAAARLPRLHLIADDGVLGSSGFTVMAGELMERAGARVALHLRGHGLRARELWRVAEACAEAAARSGAWLFVNDRVDVALGCGAGGVQLGHRSMRPSDARAILGESIAIGASVHDPGGAREAVADGADFLLAGTLFQSPSHPGEPVRGVGWLPELAALGRPLIGIGGITPGRVAEVLAGDAYGVAVLGAVWPADDPGAAVDEFLAELELEGD